MIRHLFYIVAVSLLAGFTIACNKEEKLTPSEIQMPYTLPQGNHPYDQEIVAFHEKYKSYILYKYRPIDYKYDFTDTLPIHAPVANELYVQAAIDVIKTECLNHYPESFLMKTLPYKIVLAAYMDSTYNSVGATQGVTVRSSSGMCASRNALVFGWTDSTIMQLSAQQRRYMRAHLNRAYFEQALFSGALKIPDFFYALLPPGGYDATPAAGYWRFGLLHAKRPSRSSDINWDFLCYINMITSRSKAELDATVLRPSYDVSGLIRKKYEGITKYYLENYGLDLQKIGDLP